MAGYEVPNSTPFAYMKGARLNYDTAAAVKVGTASEMSYLSDVGTCIPMRWEGQITGDLTVSGAGGLDTGSETSSTWYAVWVISHPDNTPVPTVLLSLSATAPTMPSGYTLKRRVGWIKNDSSSNILQFEQEGDWISYHTDVANLSVLSGGTATTYTDVDLTGLVPSTSFNVALSVGFATGTGGSASATHELKLRPNGSTEATPIWGLKPGFKSGTQLFIQEIMPCGTDQKLEYKVSDATKNTADLLVGAYQDRI